MKIAIDFQSTQGKRSGIGVFASSILTALKTADPRAEFLPYLWQGREDLSTPMRIYWESWVVPARAARDRADLIYSPGFASAPFSRVPQVVTAHDLIGMIFRGNQKAVSSFYWSRWLPYCLKRAKKIVASSISTQKDIERLLGIPKDQVQVVPLFADSDYRPSQDKAAAITLANSYGLTRPYYLSVGTLEPRKNIIRLLQAYKRLRDERKNSFQLAIVGKGADAEKNLRDFAATHSLEPDVVFLGYLPKKDIISLYQTALGYVTVSLYEGFGLPALEAMQCGLSGVCSDRSSLPEIVGDTALMVDPEKVDMIAEALLSYATNSNKRDLLSRAALKRAELFNSEKTAMQMLTVFKKLMQDR